MLSECVCLKFASPVITRYINGYLVITGEEIANFCPFPLIGVAQVVLWVPTITWAW